MYLFRAPNCTYYTRICLPKNLRDRGFPFDLKVSLLTKHRAFASERNLSVAAKLKSLIKNITTQTQPTDFQIAADDLINQLRANFDAPDHAEPKQAIPIRTTNAYQSDTPKISANITNMVSLKEAFASFVTSKKLLEIRPLTIYQLESRIGHFINWSPAENVADVTTAHAMRYRDELLKTGRSAKTNKDYLAACFQFFKYCKLMNHTGINPFEDVKIHKKPTKRADEERDRWSLTELQKFFHDLRFQEQGEEFRWISLIQPYSGMRPAEICQLQVSDIQVKDNIPYFSVSVDEEGKYIKNSNSIRQVPIHQKLIELGFLEYVAKRKTNGTKQLFSYKPENIFDDWSKSYCIKIGKYQTSIGMKANQRPTSYGFRHTFIDELKQKGVDEIITAQIVGHVNPSMTYGRYGKRLPLAQLSQAVNMISYDLTL